MFKLKKIDWKKLFDLVKQNKKGELKKVDFNIQQFDLIPTLIQNQTFSDFLDIYNTYVYRYLDARQRAKFQSHFFARMFGRDHVAFLKATKIMGPQKGVGKKHYEQLVAKIESEYGQNLVNALVESDSVKTKDYKKLAKKHEADVYDIRFLIKSKNKVSKPIGTMSEIVKHTIHKHRAKIKV